MIPNSNALEVIEVAKQSDSIFDSLPGLSDSSAFLRVVEQYLTLFGKIHALSQLTAEEYAVQRVDASQKLTFPAWSHNPLTWLDIQVRSAQARPDYVRNESAGCAATFATHLFKLGIRVQVATTNKFEVSFERKWQRTEAEYRLKQARLAACLKQAAEIFDSGQADPGGYASLSGYQEIDEAMWCGSDRLREWADLVERSPVEVVFPLARPHPPGLPLKYSSVGTRGAASAPEGALRGAILREIAHFVPESTPKRYTTIAELAGFSKIDVTPIYTRSLLLRGKT